MGATFVNWTLLCELPCWTPSPAFHARRPWPLSLLAPLFPGVPVLRLPSVGVRLSPCDSRPLVRARVSCSVTGPPSSLSETLAIAIAAKLSGYKRDEDSAAFGGVGSFFQDKTVSLALSRAGVDGRDTAGR